MDKPDPDTAGDSGLDASSAGHERRRILFVAPAMPARTGSGLAMRCGMFLAAAKLLGDVDVLITPIGPKADAASVTFARDAAARLIVIESDERQDTMLNLIMKAEIAEQRLAAFERYGRPYPCFNLSAPVLHDAARAVAGRRYDLCIVMRLYSLPILEAVERSAHIDRIVCDLDDDDVQFSLERSARARERGDETTARWHQIEANNYQGFLDAMDKRARKLTVANPLSIKRLSASCETSKLMVVPNAVAVEEPAAPAKTPRLLFVGILQYAPNEEGIIWFLSDVLPKIRHAIPEVETHVVGRQPSKRVVSAVKASRAVLLADVPDLTDVYGSAALAIVPLLSGSGTRIKILEAGAHGLPIVSTDKGAEGLELRHGVHGWITDADPDAFASACVEALTDSDKRSAMAQRLREHVIAHHERSTVIGSIRDMLATELADHEH